MHNPAYVTISKVDIDIYLATSHMHSPAYIKNRIEVIQTPKQYRN